MFPSLKDPEHANVRLKNVGRQVYLCVTQDDTGNPVLGTKTLNESVDPDVDFSLYYYTSAESGETKMVLPVHQATKACLSMTPDKKLQISSLKDMALLDTNELEGVLEDPLSFTKADSRFFYIKTSGSNVALEAMNGVHYNNFLLVNESNTLDIQEHNNSNYPEEVLFSVEDLDTMGMYINS
ncbi:uncharacterized protein LOC110836894 [Zootermopsis nevadensis]|uniref:Interleukin-33 n=1 Tax=Zootermopsis nevadensis TaxID=136037 RepID=A0A067QPP9_ZOONE|nr:uncharacterized protein LOC110836894 [Zootermopsis nevadensis]KDR11625.1 hypothetical protein L798_13951 [Zootermopsis nevadensis]